jgi:uncharacterized protein (TIGR03435 family)
MQAGKCARALVLLAWVCFAQSAFDVASVKPSPHAVGKDAGSQVTFGPAGINGRNVTLKQLIVAAYGLQPYQVFGGPGWLDVSEYDVEAKAVAPVAFKGQIEGMLQALLADRFRLSAHRETRELRIYELVVVKGGPKIQPIKDSQAPAPPFRGNLDQFANFLSIQLSIPAIDDPTKPSIASGPPVPVVDNTGLFGVYDIAVDVKPEPGGDAFTLWQRFLRDQLGLRLESKKEAVEVLVIDHAERAPSAN